ncbi:MAG: hypothetical protein GFH27_549307n125 [Chloroflexi bacterium AL-W]|nr:hypothetical protein [Chloroflexi bacterium AL-N1]NOK69157.1 hypothetical protein [Chloroflexi bacterium AL-N10]NOK77140.1 hypothetical protein [Chloroflexi bacterium AL-N5]NOK83785.1 hypothetical protein [Chloroflexi bacterium AL-W]NOK90995.1 hypothetical protein [Chloroflexi bacterium AL-N15]
MRRANHAQNSIVASVIIFAILLANQLWNPSSKYQNESALAAPLQQVNFVWSPGSSSETDINPGDEIEFTSDLENDGVDDTFNITFDLPDGWSEPSFTPGESVPIAEDAEVRFNFFFDVPDDADPGRYRIEIIATRASNNTQTRAILSVEVVAEPTETPTPEPTEGPTPTPQPVCPNDPDDPSSDSGGARLLLVNLPEDHGICVQGDIDWFQFGGVGGKEYTIEVTEMDPGLDLVIEIYDPDLNLLIVNDDDFSQPPDAPNPNNLRPRVQSFRAPVDGLYYIRVRDSLDLGGRDGTYIIGVFGESYGPTPAVVPAVCRDLFEEDGLPEEATLITSNEVQPNHALCPEGDADWVRFFGSAGKTYYIYTDTRPYSDGINADTQAGADTTLLLTDRDGQSVLAFNDDIPGSLDSEIQFTPRVDGFYFAQVKNIGDIGNQFIRYDLVLLLCVPGEDCGRAPPQPTVQPDDPGNIGDQNGTPTPTDDLSFDDELETAEVQTETQAAIESETPTSTPDDDAFSIRSRGSEMINGAVEGFVDPSFATVWNRSDRPVAEQIVPRSWMWGPRGLMARAENYTQSQSGMRQVEYFDKARMEINNPSGDEDSSWFVTTGLLVVELVSGQMQIGDNNFVNRAPADIPIAGDADDANAPTYASFVNLIVEPTGDRTGQAVDEMIDRSGRISDYTGSQSSEIHLAHFVPETGHNIPDAFWDYLNAQGIVYENGDYQNNVLFDWVFTLGYPISEPYWSTMRVGGEERDVLIQVYERRVLTYSPDNPEGWQVEMGNVGRHYYLWRYGENLPS